VNISEQAAQIAHEQRHALLVRTPGAIEAVKAVCSARLRQRADRLYAEYLALAIASGITATAAAEAYYAALSGAK
jgi:hypothetical protein